MQAYDLSMLPRGAERTSPDCRGWCFGLPPGISPEQWPLDPANGYPLQHGFTLLLPEDYRCHGPEIVAVSFFASATDMNDGGPIVEAPEIGAAMAGPTAPADPSLLPFWQTERSAHPRLHRFEDILSTAYAAILLTRSEFDGPFCTPIRLDNPHVARLPPPRWMTIGSGAAFWADTFTPSLSLPMEAYGVYRMFGEQPEEDLAWNRALGWAPRTQDPNAGRTPWDLNLHPPTDYVQPFFFGPGADGPKTYHKHAWAEGFAPNHIGGTMRPVQAVPRFSPYYVEFEEYLGGYNFGGGNAQLDIRNMMFEWACG